MSLQVYTSRFFTGSCSIYCAAYLQVYASRLGKTPSFLWNIRHLNMLNIEKL